jgi:hypothetical protein
VVQKIAPCAFNHCSELLTVDAPNVTSVADSAFSSCTALVSVSLPAAIGNLGKSSFNTCTSLLEVKFPNIETIPSESASGSGVFADCHSLRKADFSKLTSIGGRSFYGCYALIALILRSDSVCALTGTNILNATPIATSGNYGHLVTYGTGYIYVPAALIEDYKVATNWSTYASQFRALEDYTVDGTITGELDESKI